MTGFFVKYIFAFGLSRGVPLTFHKYTTRDNVDPCDCQRCQGASRSTTVGVCGARHMCEPEPSYIADAKFLCTVPNDSELMKTDRGTGVPKEKFCLHSCVPQQDAETLNMIVGSQCGGITSEQMALVPDEAAGVDPACVIAHLEGLDPDFTPIVENTVAAETTATNEQATPTVSAENDNSQPAEQDPSAKPMDETDTMSLHTGTLKGESTILSVRASQAAAKAEAAAIEGASSERSASEAAHRNLGLVADMRSLLRQAVLYKQSAWKAREMSKNLYANMESLADKASMVAAAKAKSLVVAHIQQAQALANFQQGQFFPPSPPSETSSEVGRAIAPYVEAKARAEKIMNRYQQAATHESERARQMHENAKTLLKQALDFQTGGRDDLAQQYHAQADQMFKTAQALQEKALEADHLASQAAGSLHLYDRNVAHMSVYTGHNVPMFNSQQPRLPF